MLSKTLNVVFLCWFWQLGHVMSVDPAPVDAAVAQKEDAVPRGKSTVKNNSVEMNVATPSPPSTTSAFPTEGTTFKVVPALDWSDITKVSRSAVQARCMEILASLSSSTDASSQDTQDAAAASVVWPMASYWEPNATALKSPLYYSAAEGDVNRTMMAFTPTDIWTLTSSPTSVQDTTNSPLLTTVGGQQVTADLILSSATNTTPIDVAGTVCSMNVAATYPRGCNDKDNREHIGVRARTLLELNQFGRIVKWINSVDEATWIHDKSKSCHKDFGYVNQATAAYEVLPPEVIRAACMDVFAMIFPPFGQTLGSLFGLANLFTNSYVSFPEGNEKMTETAIVSGWNVFGFFMHKLNPFETPTMARVTSSVDVTRNVCSFDQELTITFAKAISTPSIPTMCQSLKVPGRVLLEVDLPPPSATTMSSGPIGTILPPSIVRLVSQFDNSTFWGGINDCTTAVKAVKADVKAKKRAAKAEKKKRKEQAAALRKAENEQLKKARDDSEVPLSSSSFPSTSMMADWMAGGSFATSSIPLFLEVAMAALLGVWAVTVVVHHVRNHIHRTGYQPVDTKERTTLLTV